jgi:hypothetical protein
VARRKVERLYLVERVLWEVTGTRRVRKIPPYLEGQARPNPFTGKKFLPVYRRGGQVPTRAYLSRENGEEDCRARNDAAWEGINPFHYGQKVADWSSFDQGRLRDWLLDHGLEPPAGKLGVDKWRGWYDGVQGALDDLQRRAIRQGLDRIVFFQVSELTE